MSHANASSSRRTFLQARHTIGGSNDPLEHEAERIADHVLAAPAHHPVSGATPRIQRASGSPATHDGVAPAAVDEVLARPGAPMPPALRHDMEERFGYDFSRVRMHHDPAAGRSARDVDAHAYTAGQHIVFGEGRYAPGTHDGRRLIAHELTHVVQPSGGNAGTHAIDSLPGPRGGALVQAHRAPAVSAAGDGIVQRAGFGDRARDAYARVKRAIDPQTRQFISDMVASVRESPGHVKEFFTDELWESIKEHWVSIVAVSVGLMAAEAIIGALEVAPTGVTQIIGAILEVIVVAVLGYFAAVEVAGVAEEGIRWWSAAKAANGDPKQITEASRAFVRMVWHIFMAVLAVAGVRARVKGGALGRIKAPFEPKPIEPVPPPAVARPPLRSIDGGNRDPVPMRGGKVAGPRSGAGSGRQGPVASGRGGGAEPALPQQAPLPEPEPLLKPAPDPAPALDPGPTAKAGVAPKPGVQPGPAAGAGLATANQPKKKKEPADACEERLGLAPGVNARWHRQRAPISGETTVHAAAFRLDAGVAPPVGQDTTEPSRNWVRRIGMPDDDAGHVIANRFGGTAAFNSPVGNLFPEHFSFNRGTMRSYDDVVARLHDSGCDVCVNIGLMYDQSSSLRPSAALYTYFYRSAGATGFNPLISAVLPNP